ncbi:MAG: MerR family transcriptional regulator [Balneolales bacterium]
MKKLYYTIGEVSKLAGIKPHVLRYWETIFDSLSPSKNRAGNRVYTEKNISTVLELKKLIQEEKYSTAGAKKAIRRSNLDPQKELPEELKGDLSKVRSFLNNLLQEI